MNITQPLLATALGGVSVPLISSWESASNPKIPPLPRLEAYATFFATQRSLEGGSPRLLSDGEMTPAERQVRDDLRNELMHLRGQAMSVAGAAGAAETAEAAEVSASLSAGPWRFEDGKPITIICAQLPAHLLERIPYTDPADPQYVGLYTYADLDALFELHGHLRAANPTSQVNLRAAQKLQPDDYTTHLVLLGGIDWNVATRSVLDRLGLPVRQVAGEGIPESLYFEAERDARAVRHRPVLEDVGEGQVLRQDVALFARAVNPYNRRRTVSICNGMFGGGTYGAVRALTDARFRDRNAQYLAERFAGSESFCVLTRVAVENGVALTPDWTLPENRLFEWSTSPPC